MPCVQASHIHPHTSQVLCDLVCVHAPTIGAWCQKAQYCVLSDRNGQLQPQFDGNSQILALARVF